MRVVRHLRGGLELYTAFPSVIVKVQGPSWTTASVVYQTPPLVKMWMSVAIAARLGLPPHHGHTSSLRLLKSSVFLYSSGATAFQILQQDKQNRSIRAPARMRMFFRCGFMSGTGVFSLRLSYCLFFSPLWTTTADLSASSRYLRLLDFTAPALVAASAVAFRSSHGAPGAILPRP